MKPSLAANIQYRLAGGAPWRRFRPLLARRERAPADRDNRLAPSEQGLSNKCIKAVAVVVANVVAANMLTALETNEQRTGERFEHARSDARS